MNAVISKRCSALPFFAIALLSWLAAGSINPVSAATTIYTSPYAGGTISPGDTVVLDDGATITGDITNNGTLQFNQTSGTNTMTNVLTGSGTLSLINAGTLMLTGTSVSLGIGLDMTTTVDSGRLLIGKDGGRSPYLGNTNGGVGTLSINGGYVGNGTSYLGYAAGGQASVTVSSGTWANGSFTYVGWYGSATLNVTGGSVTGTIASIGRHLGSVGSVTVSSGGQWSLTSNLTVGEQGTGSLTIGNGGLVVVKGNLVRGASGTINLNAGGTLQIGTGTNSGSLLGGTGSLTNNGTVVFNRSNASTYSGALSGSGAVTKLGLGTLTFGGSAANTLTGTTTVSAGTLKLDKSASTTAIAGSVEVATGATLLISQSEQVNDASAVTLSGGTIRTAAGVDETFGNLSITGSGFLDFGTTSYANANTISFGDYIYTPSALLTINNFNFGSTMTFGSNLNSADLATFSFTNGGIGSSSWDGSTFTITAIPEPSTYIAALGLLALTLWPSRRRLIKDAKSILGLRAPMRDRLAGRG